MSLIMKTSKCLTSAGHCCLALLLMLLLSRLALAQATPPTPTSAAAPAMTNIADLEASLEKSLAAEYAQHQEFRDQLKEAEHLEKTLGTEFHTYNLQISVYNSLLSAPTTSAEEFGKVLTSLRATRDNLALRLKELQERAAAFEQMRQEAADRNQLNRQQFDELKADSSLQTAKDRKTKEFLKKLQLFTEQLAQDLETLAAIQEIYTALNTQCADIQKKFTDLETQFTETLQSKQKAELFARRTDSLKQLKLERLRSETQEIIQRANALIFTQSSQMLVAFANIDGLRLVLMAVVMVFFIRQARMFFTRLRHATVCEEFPLRWFWFSLVKHSLSLVGAFGLVELGRMGGLLSPLNDLDGLFISILFSILATRWLLDLVRFWQDRLHEVVLQQIFNLCRRLLFALRYFMIGYAAIEYALGSGSMLLLLGRTLGEISVLLWSLRFVHLFQAIPAATLPKPLTLQSSYRPLVIALSYLIPVVGLFVMEFAGYGPLAWYWYLSWFRTAVVALWTVVTFAVLREWEVAIKDRASTAQPAKTAHQIQWLIVRLTWLALPCLGILGVLLAWGAKQLVFAKMLAALTYRMPLAGFQISVLSGLHALLALLGTYIATRLWQRFLTRRFLVNSALEEGVQVSIITISVYLLWFLGMLWALYAFGVGATSLAVAFGTLGIGLGFGLQSIFNNFISGLILLFERPIEVQDVLEVKGVWGVVEKINVRSTVIRTFDNSALIIPNADMISNQVTNWTFQDARVRRALKVGVAYNSDVKFVESLLFEICQAHPRVLSEPAPMVIFANFGENALEFVVYVWTLLDYGMTTESELRFEIVRRFREHNITIPLPQREVHVQASANARLSSPEGSILLS